MRAITEATLFDRPVPATPEADARAVREAAAKAIEYIAAKYRDDVNRAVTAGLDDVVELYSAIVRELMRAAVKARTGRDPGDGGGYAADPAEDTL
jgi:hypothetical protein